MDAAIDPLHPLLNGNAEIPLCGLAAGKIPSRWVHHRIGGSRPEAAGQRLRPRCSKAVIV
jgi:hypothetical protein